jgi:hypothetical protein
MINTENESKKYKIIMDWNGVEVLWWDEPILFDSIYDAEKELQNYIGECEERGIDEDIDNFTIITKEEYDSGESRKEFDKFCREHQQSINS